jgi:hypothetical protein
MSSLKIGDLVSVLDEDLSGKIVKIDANKVTLLTIDGFELQFTKKELIKTGNQNFKEHIFLSQSTQDVIAEKEISKKRKQPKIKPKERTQPTLEIDLHIHQLTKSNKHMNKHDMLTLQLETAKRQLEFAINKHIQKVVFIHGIGEGILKLELEYLFGRYNNVKFYDANYQKYGLGATEVYIYQNGKM